MRAVAFMTYGPEPFRITPPEPVSIRGDSPPSLHHGVPAAVKNWLSHLFSNPARPPSPAGWPENLPDTSLLSEAEKYDLYDKLYRCAGELDRTVGHVSLLGLRITTSTRAGCHLDRRTGGIDFATCTGAFDDRVVILWTTRNERGGIEKHVREYAANTEPSSFYEGREGRDANGDGVKDLGRVPDGLYTYAVRPEAHAQLGLILKPAHAIALQRDTNHDGAFNGADAVRDRRQLMSGRSVYFHAGRRDGKTGSAGCQTLRPDQFQDFLAHLFDARRNPQQQNCHYALVTIR